MGTIAERELQQHKDEETLNHLEGKLALAQQEVINANLDEKLRILTNARVQQQQRLRSYEEELKRLEEEVKLVKKINDSLPMSCWREID